MNIELWSSTRKKVRGFYVYQSINEFTHTLSASDQRMNLKYEEEAGQKLMRTAPLTQSTKNLYVPKYVLIKKNPYMQ